MGSQCCSTNCSGGFCARAYSCQATDDICSSNAACCSNLCSVNDGGVGRCNVTGGCTQDGNPCSGGSNCCSRLCADLGSGAKVCLPASGCRLTGNTCDTAQECCGGGTNPNGSVACTGSRCDNGTACNPVGNICGAKVLPDGGSINASQNCCNGLKEVCKLDGAGIPRCFGGFSANCPTGYTGQSPCCISAGQACQFKDQCCNGTPCVPGADGGLSCASTTCQPLEGRCTNSADCCSGAGCLNGACAPATCGAAGQTCSPTAGCCTGLACLDGDFGGCTGPGPCSCIFSD